MSCELVLPFAPAGAAPPAAQRALGSCIACWLRLRLRAARAMESDTERGVGSFGNDGEELSPMMTITSLNRGMDSIVAKAGTLSTLDNIKGITSFERKFKRAIDTTPFGCYSQA